MKTKYFLISVLTFALTLVGSHATLVTLKSHNLEGLDLLLYLSMTTAIMWIPGAILFWLLPDK